mgnify:CR=1 FL=1
MLHLTDLFTLPDHKLVEKVKSEKACRACCVRRSEHRALTIGWLAEETIDPRGGVALCGHCLEDQLYGDLDLWPHLRPDEIMFAVRAHGGQEQARRALMPSDYSRTMEAQRKEAA